MKCLIIAAGCGSRLSGKGDVKPLALLLGRPLIQRVMETAKKAGVSEFCVVVGYKSDALTAALEKIGKETSLKITVILNAQWVQGNGLSVYKAKEFLEKEDSFVLLMSDHLFDPATLEALMREKLAHGEVMLAVDRKIKGNEFVDMEDVTRVLEKGGRIMNIGKQLVDYNAFDTGMFLCAPSLFEALERSMSEHGDHSLSGGMRILREEGRARTFDIKGGFWIDIDDNVMFTKAERSLKTTPSHPAPPRHPHANSRR